MSVALPRSPEAPARPAAGNQEWWLRPLRWGAMLVWLAIPVVTFLDLYPPWPAHIVWSAVIAGLPLFIVLIGYHRWRDICPLAFFSRIPVLARRPGTRRASPRFEERYYYIMFGLFALGLWLRLVGANGNARVIALMFVGLSVAAFIFGVLFTGKTWCNYICPVSLIEKINTEPQGLRETPNSQCAKCTACKKSCPDINEENGYWKEIDLRSKRFAYYAFPGLVFAFYFYFYLQDGTWGYYFRGGWADQARLISRAFFPDDNAMSAGFFFLPEIPRWLAAAMTLVAGTMVSYWLFSRLEPLVGRWLRQRQPEADAAATRHVTFTVAAFVAFVNFYLFAGQPLLLLATPWVGNLVEAIAIVAGAVYFVRRIGRTQKAFAEESVAQNIIKRWEWPDMRPPKDLREAFLIHAARSAERKVGYAQVLEVYQEAVRETLAHGLATREDIQRLESLRTQLQIKKADHEKIMATLAEEERALITDASKRPSSEKRLQLETYRRALEQHLKLVLAAEGGVDDSFLRRLRSEYNVTEEEHAAQLDALLGGTEEVAAKVVGELHEVAQARQTIRSLDAEPLPIHELLTDLLRRKRARAVDRLIRALQFDPAGDAGRTIRDELCSEDAAAPDAAFETLRTRVTPAIGQRLLAARQSIAAEGDGRLSLTERLRAQIGSADPYVRAAALYALAERGALDLESLHQLSEDEHELVRDTLRGLTERMRGGAGAVTGPPRLTTIEKMLALHSVWILASLEPEHLAGLAEASIGAEYAPEALLVKEGEQGDEAFIVLTGEVLVVRAHGAHEDVIDRHAAGALVGEMAVLDPAPRAATLRAGAAGARVLRLDGAAFREALNADPAVAHGVIRTLTQRMRALIRQVHV